MPKTKLTVRVPRDLIKNAKRYAAQNNTTLTNLIEAYLRRIPPPGWIRSGADCPPLERYVIPGSIHPGLQRAP